MNRFSLLALFACLIAAPLVAFAHEGPTEMFKKMDTNHDGKISAAEHEAGCTDMWNKMDADHNGEVTAGEMEDFHNMKMGHHQPMEKAGHGMNHGQMGAPDKIAAMDKNGDGKLSQQEYMDGSKDMFTKMDTDGDGFLTMKEFKEGHMKMMKKAH